MTVGESGLKSAAVIVILFMLYGCGKSNLEKAVQEDKVSRARSILTFRPSLLKAQDQEGRTLLHEAVLRGQQEMADLFIDKKAVLNGVDRYGLTPLHYAALRGEAGIIRMLIEKGADMEVATFYGHTPLHLAALWGHEDTAEILVQAGSDFLAEDNDGRTPAQSAFDAGHVRLARRLMLLHDAARRGDMDEIRRLLAAHPGMADLQDSEGKTPLHWAQRYDRSEAVQLLIEAGADPDREDAYGNASEFYGAAQRQERTGEEFLDSDIADDVDRLMYGKLPRYPHISVALVVDGRIVLAKTYGRGRLDAQEVWGSVSKSVTAMIVMHLLTQGIIESIDDPIWKYSQRYAGCMPEEYADTPVTIRHLLIHKSGVPHNNEPTWKDEKLNLKFRPGTEDQYSTPGYGILGDVIEGATGKTYSQAVEEYIGAPVGADSFWAEEHFRAPGARVHSTVRDMALFSIGIMDHAYVSPDMFYEEMIQHWNGPAGMGWGITHWDSPDLTVFHGGSNGRPQAYLMVKPKKRLSVSILATAKSGAYFDLTRVAIQLMALLD